MLQDRFTMLSGVANTPQVIGTATTAGVASTDWLDLQVARSLGSGPEYLLLRAIVVAAITSASNVATVEFQLRGAALPPTALTQALTATTNTMPQPAAGRLDNGTRVIVTVAGGTGLSTTQSYYVINANALTFQLSVTPPGGAVAVAAVAITAGAVTIAVQPEILGSSGPVPIQRLVAGGGFGVLLNPHPANPGVLVPVTRYVYAFVLPSANLSAGSVRLPLLLNPQDGAQTHYASGFDIA